MSISLYELIKKISQEKGRPLKIICDWDECLLPREAFGHYLYYQELTGKCPPFAEFFKEFWEKSEYAFAKGEEHLSFCTNSGIKEIEEIREGQTAQNWEDAKNKSKATEIMRSKRDFYEVAPFLTFSEDLLKALKEKNLISDLIIPQNYHAGRKGYVPSSQNDVASCPRKRWKMRKTFSKFSQARNEINKPIVLTSGKQKKITRAEWTINNHPDFDIFIDDNPCTLQELVNFYPNKTFVIPDYKMNREVKGENVYRFPVKPINLTDQNFSIASLECKSKKIEQGIQELKQQKTISSNSNIPTWLIAFPIISIVLALLVWIVVGKKRKKLINAKQKTNPRRNYSQ